MEPSEPAAASVTPSLIRPRAAAPSQPPSLGAAARSALALKPDATRLPRRRLRERLQPPGCTSQWIVLPSAPWLHRWVQLLVTVLLYNTCSIPFQVAFEQSPEGW